MRQEYTYLVDVRDTDGGISSGQVVVEANSDEDARRAVIGCMMESGRNVLRIVRLESPVEED